VVSTADLDELMRLGWPALSEVEVSGWIARLSDGVSRRANSVLPAAAPNDLENALARVEQLYGDHGLAPTFQLSPAAQPVALDEVLACRGYELQGPTAVHVAVIKDVLRQLPPSTTNVRVLDEPDADWFDLWWSVDGRGGATARAVARHILTSCPALYASTVDRAGVTAVGRVALVGEWAGVYCMAVRADVRRRGLAMSVMRALLKHATDRDGRSTWLQVIADNLPARTLYERVGFVQASKYHYRTRGHTIRTPQPPSGADR
jgi:ribosomal protein S18 acetylase RimI-like enzyme